MTNCKHFEVCSLGAAHPHSTGGCCILHLPSDDKSAPDFDLAVKQQLDSGRSDFRYVYFPRKYAGFEGVEFPALADFRDATILPLHNLRRSRLPHGLLITTNKRLGVDLFDATVVGLVDVRVSTLDGINAYMTKFLSDISIEVNDAGAVDLRSELNGRVTLRGRFTRDCTFDGAKIRGILDLRDCQFHSSPTFRGTVFAPSSKILLGDSVFGSDSPQTGKLMIIGSPTSPSLIEINGSTIRGAVRIEAELGATPPRISAKEQHPRFGSEVTLTNVDLSECRLVGNVIARIDLTNARWPQRFGRSVLYDEIAMRQGAPIPFSSLKEAYQILKQKYQLMGDHARAGDFHYGEMEMRRHEYGRLKRFLCLEFLYWLASGYGTGYLRALLVLATLVVVFAGVYWVTSPESFNSNFWKALLFSIKVTTLQRPPAPDGFTLTGQWFQAAQAVLGPLQIGLFALALRMRLRR